MMTTRNTLLAPSESAANIDAPKTFQRKLLASLIPGLIAMSAGSPASVFAQTDPTTSTEADSRIEVEPVIVTGYRQSLENASSLKRESTNFVDSVFAEDIGKFPDLNIAESLSRVPGIQLTRNVDGTGLNVAIRGLNTNFTKTTLNGAPIGVASSGRLDSTNGNREVDLDIFPIEFFSKLEVKKSSTASMLEGGVAGTVNIRTMRPFDIADNQLAFDAQGIYGELSKSVTPRASLTANWSNEDQTFGVLFGFSAVDNNIVTQGYETGGWTTAQLTYEQCGVSAPAGSYPGSPVTSSSAAYSQCNPGGGDAYIIGTPIYRGLSGETIPQPGYHVISANTSITGGSGTIYGPGDRIDNNLLLDINPDLTISQISNGLMPITSRPHYSDGDRSRKAALLSFQLQPNDNIELHLDTLWATNTRDFNRLSMSLVARNSNMIPANMQLDSNNVVVSGDFYNSQFMLEATPYDEELDFFNINPGAQFNFSDSLTLSMDLNVSDSSWSRESPTIAVVTAADAGIAAHYQLSGSDGPSITPNLDLNDPDQVAGWQWQEAYLQNEERESKSTQFRTELLWGDSVDNVTFGLQTHNAERIIEAFDGSYSWRTEGVTPSIPDSQIAQYLSSGPDGFVAVDYDALFSATNYETYNAEAGLVPTSSTAARTGSIEEDTVAAYVEYNHEYYVHHRPLRINAGLRYVRTDHTVTVPTNFGFAQELIYVEDEGSYSELLPSANLAWEFKDGWWLRSAISKSLTRANPSSMLPSTIFVDPSAQYANRGNPDLDPFTSTNLDLGVEWYADNEGYAALNLFQKTLQGFVTDRYQSIPFEDLGIGFDFLSNTQQDAINQRGGPENAQVSVGVPVNSNGDLTIYGAEISWTQPLEQVLDGLGYSVNYTHVKQSNDGEGVPNFATFVSENTASFTSYYEKNAFTIRATYVWYDEQYAGGIGTSNVPFAQLKVEPRGQWDLSASYEFVDLPTSPAITLNISNLNGDPQRQNFEFNNAPYSIYDPGTTIMLGVRGKF